MAGRSNAAVRRTHCHQGHDFAVVGRLADRSCRRCALDRRKRQRQQRRAAASTVPGLIPAGKTVEWARRSATSKLAWETIRARYGPSGKSPAGLAAFVRKRKAYLRATLAQRRKTHCLRGHEYNDHNTRSVTDPVTGIPHRWCRVCQRRRVARPTRGWVTQQINGRWIKVSLEAHDRFHFVRLVTLRAALIAAHPDKGGSASRFIRVRARFDQFLQREQCWYADLGLRPPKSVRKSATLLATPRRTRRWDSGIENRL